MSDDKLPWEVWAILLVFAVGALIFGICVLLNQYGIFSGAWFNPV